MNGRLIAVVSAVAFPLLAHAPHAWAESSPLSPSVGVHLGVEYYSWEEFDASGARLVRESGPRGTVSLSLDNTNRRTSGPIYSIDGRGYYGDVNYNGQTQPGPPVPVMSNTRYLGGLGELAGGYRFANVFGNFGLDLLGSVGLEAWQRRIGDTRTAGGTFVSGSTEDYRVFYAKGGIGLFAVEGGWSHYVRIEAKEPISTRESAHFASTSVVVHPRRNVSFYFGWEIDRLNERQERTFGVTIYYDSLRFDQSPSVQVGGETVYQPASYRDTVGVELGYYFDPF